MNWHKTSVLVTGAGGFIGSHLVEELVARGANVRALVHYNGRGIYGWLDHSKAADNIEVVLGDVTDPDFVLSIMQNIDVVFHLAALIAIPFSYHAPLLYQRTNVEGTLNVLRAAKMLGTSRMIHTSTSEVYGSAQMIPINEQHVLQGQSPYSASKIGADKIVEAYNLSFGVPTVTIRPFNTYGPRQSLRAIIPTIIVQALKGKKIKLGHLHPTRDLNYVLDTVNGFIKAAEAENVLGETINIGSGQEISIGDLAQKLAKRLNTTIDIETEDQRLRPVKSEVERLCADNQKALTLLGWKPQVTLDEGLDKTIDWIKNNHKTLGVKDFQL